MGRSAEQDQIRRMHSRALLVRAALELFAERGYHTTTTAEVAERAGLSKGLLYHYFSDKQALLEAVLVDRLQQLEQWLGEMPADAPESERLVAFARAAAAWAQRDPAQLRLYLRALTDDETREMAGRIVREHARWVRLAPEPGDDARLDLRLFRASLLGILTLAVLSPLPTPVEPLVEHLVRTLRSERP